MGAFNFTAQAIGQRFGVGGQGVGRRGMLLSQRHDRKAAVTVAGKEATRGTRRVWFRKQAASKREYGKRYELAQLLHFQSGKG